MERPPAAKATGGERLLDQYGRMLLIRRFEERTQALFVAGEVHGTTHLCAGQEAVPVGVCGVLQAGDMVSGTYRGHGHTLALGTEPAALAAELLGRSTGVCGGRAGSMNVIDLEHGLLGCFGIVGGSIGAATGAALSARLNGGVAVAFFGDGAANQAYFSECLNLARVRSLPVLFVCENNLYGEFTPMAAVTAGGDISKRAAVFDVGVQKVDGNDVTEVEGAAADAVERARRGDGPEFLECLTYRHFGHSRSDPGDYRPDGELDEWLARDPLTVARHKLERDGVSGDSIAELEAEIAAEAEAAFDAALAAPYPTTVGDGATEYAG